MNLLVVLAALMTLTTTLALLPLNMRLSTRWKLVADPDPRRIHTVQTPEAGGLSFALPMIILQLLVGLFYRDVYGNQLTGLALAGLFAVVFGILDDRYELKPLPKLLGYLGLALVMYLLGFRVLNLTNPFGTEISLSWLSFPVTIFWFLAIINAINLIDGVDGLAAGITVITSAVLLVVGIKGSNPLVILVSAMLMMGNLGFLRYNFHPARIFMGDTGATFIGLNLAAITTAGDAQFKGITSMTLIIPLAVMAIPLLDVAFAIVRRISKGKVFTADKAHIHHTMLGMGLSQRAISIIVYVVTLLFGLIAIGFSFTDKKILFLVLMGALCLMVILAYILMRLELKK